MPRRESAGGLALASISRETIGARPAPALAEAPEPTEGVPTSRPGGLDTKAFVCGLGGERVVAMLDGNRLNRACNIGMDGGLATINPDNVERVELLAGPGLTRYGSGNVGGVINLGCVGSDSAAPAGWLEASAGARIDRVIRRAEEYPRTAQRVASGNAGLRATHPN